MSDRERSRSRSPDRNSAPPSDTNGNGNLNNGAPGNDPEVKLYIGNICYDTDDRRLREVFDKFGTITDAFVPKEKGSNRPRGFGFVTFSTRDQAMAAMKELDGTELDGRTIKISESKPRERNTGPFNASGSHEVKLFVGNLSFETETENIRALFSKIGEVRDCYMPVDKGTSKPRGFAFVTMPAASAEEAMNKLTGEIMDGRPIRIEEAGGKKANRDGDFRRDGGGYGGDRYGGDRGYDRGGYGGRSRDYDRGSDRGYERRRDHDRDDRRRDDRGYGDRRRDYDKDDRGYGDRRRDYDRDDRYERENRDRESRYRDDRGESRRDNY